MRGLSDDARAWGRPAVIGLATALVLLLDLIFGDGTVYPHLFYLIIVPAAFWYGRRAVAAGLLLAAIHIAVETLLHGSPGAAVAIQAGSFIVAAYLLGYLFEIASRRADGLHFRIGEQVPGAPACDRNTQRLISRLTSRDPDARYQAAGCLGDLGDPAAVTPLAALLKDEESGVRWKAVEALGKMGSPAVGPLTESLQSPDPDVRWMAAVALGDIGDPAAIPALMGALEDPDTYVRSRAALALAAIGKPARAGLIARLRDGNERVRWGAALALGSIGGESAVAALIGALRDPEEEVRERARGALGDIGDAAVPPLIEAFATDDDGLRREAAAALGLVGRPAIAPLTAALGSGDRRIRAGAATALGEIGDPRSVDALIAALEDEGEGVREAARQALGSIRKT